MSKPRGPKPRRDRGYYPGNQDPHKSLQPIRSSNSRSRLPGDQRSTTESTEIHGKENPSQLPLSVSFPGATPARRVGSFRGYPFVMIFLVGVIRFVDPASPKGLTRARLFDEATLNQSSTSPASTDFIQCPSCAVKRNPREVGGATGANRIARDFPRRLRDAIEPCLRSEP
jgi:hypothetical protein